MNRRGEPKLKFRREEIRNVFLVLRHEALLPPQTPGRFHYVRLSWRALPHIPNRLQAGRTDASVTADNRYLEMGLACPALRRVAPAAWLGQWRR